MTHETAGVSFGTLFIILFIQTSFATHGLLIKDKFIGLSNCAAALVSFATLLSAYYFSL